MTPKEMRKIPKDADLSLIAEDLRVLAVPVGILTGHPDNPRIHPQANLDAIKGSVRRFKQRKPVVCNLVNGALRVEAGHGLLSQLVALGAQYVAVQINEDTPNDELGYMLADNRTGDLSEDDEGKLAGVLKTLLEAGEDVEEIGFDDEVVKQLIGKVDDGDEDEGDDDAPIDKAAELQKKWKTVLGGIWAVESITCPGKCHRVMCGDSLDPATIEAVLDGQVPDGVWSDAPYGMFLDADYSSAKSGLSMAGKSLKGGRKYDNVIGDHEDFDPGPIMSKIPDKAEQFWWGADYYAERLHGKNDGSWLVWDKRLEESADRMYGSCFELCWSKQRHKRDMIRIKWAGVFGTEKEQAVVGKTKRVHPTQKPIALFEWCSKKYLPDPGKVWLDPFAGSGISILGAERCSQIACAVELSESYVAVILERATLAGLTVRRVS